MKTLIRHVVASWTFVVLAALVSEQLSAADNEWSYVVSGDREFAPPGLQIARLDDVAPDDVAIDIEPRGKPRFAQIRYGTSDSVRVTLIIDEHPAGFDIYVDKNRDRRISVKDKTNGNGSTRYCPLKAQVVDSTGTKHELRQLVLKYRSQRLFYGTAGYVEGKLRLSSNQVVARRMDMNGNGLLTDPEDRVIIDLDSDGRWNALTEQFAYRPVLRLDGRRYALQSDLLGRHFSANEIVGTGKVRMELADEQHAERVAEISVVLTSRDGTVAHMDRLNRLYEVPVGEYRLLSVVLTLTQLEPPHEWTFVFSNMRRSDSHWYDVSRDHVVTINPLGELSFVGELDRADVSLTPGEGFLINPRLYTGDGLRLQTSYWGGDTSGPDGQPHATVAVRVHKGDERVLASKECGFA